jgi:hypothetical protein
MARNFTEDVDAQLIITIGAISGFLTIVATIGLQAWYSSEELAELEQKSARAVNRPLVELVTKQKENISSYRWIDEQKRVAAIPVEQAMAILIESNGKLPATQPAR